MPLIITVAGDEVTVRFKLSDDMGPSQSGLSQIVATTSGNKPIEGTDVKLGLTAFRPNRRPGN